MFELFTVHTIVPRLGGCKDVKLNWFVYQRNSPLDPPYQDLIKNYHFANPVNRRYAELEIEEMFTAEEAKRLIEFLDSNFPEGVQHVRNAAFPIANDSMGFGGLSVGGPTGFIDLGREENWNLPFKASGYYDLRNYEPLPDRESDLLRRQIFASGTIYISKGRVILASDLEKIAPLN